MIKPYVLAPGSKIGILGGGQLGKMTALAAAGLGYKTSIFCPDPDSPAFICCDHALIAEYDDETALKMFADQVDVITFEFENIPLKSAEFLSQYRPLYPAAHILKITQHRLYEKDFLNQINIPTTLYISIKNDEDINNARSFTGFPAILKSARMGYDGKGQISVQDYSDLKKAWDQLGQVESILEAKVNFLCEISVIVARNIHGQIECFEPVENIHKHHILYETRVPASISDDLKKQSLVIAEKIAQELKLIGVLAIEMFVVEDQLLVNELAPRPHNSGHWTLDASYTSQFEQLVRAICGLPLGSPKRHSNAVMINLLGDDIKKWQSFLQDPTIKLHIYGKTEPKPGRKMGHITKVFPLEK
ncbi:MAG: 5-(carboxyamino)imidazole ribonucleotide synthase [Alphaproteobacteria bacterium]|nr:5-(carboxyamino)imidazole ribonucleotide synthase [Alphaproteobacteria bacterium]